AQRSSSAYTSPCSGRMMAIGSPAKEAPTTCPGLSSCDHATGYQLSGCAPTRRKSTGAPLISVSTASATRMSTASTPRCPEVDREDLLGGLVNVDRLSVAADELKDRFPALAPHSAH